MDGASQRDCDARIARSGALPIAFVRVVMYLALVAAAFPAAAVSPPLSGVTQISAGTSHACARLADGSVRCWGSNHGGQIGDGSLREAPSATPVASLGTTVSAVAVGDAHSCALTANGSVKCWGANGSGQLGAVGSTGSRLPVDVSALGNDAIAIVAGGNHSCALTASGGAKCWGSNDQGQLGNGTFVDAFAPIDVQGLASGVMAIAAGHDFTCAISTSGAVKCWGANNVGQLGNGSVAAAASPVDVSGLSSGATAVSLGYDHACATTASGIRCWGSNHGAQLANGSSGTIELTPVDAVLLPAGLTALALGRAFTCALTATQTVRCIGLTALGNGTMRAYEFFTDVEQLALPVQSISAGFAHACALLADTTVKCWGDNTSGQAGNGTTWREPAPIPVPMLGQDTARLAILGSHACRVNAGSGVNCWGSNVFGELGTNSLAQWLSPAILPDLMTGVLDVSVGANHSCALTLAGGVMCWGWNHYGQLGNPTFMSATRPTSAVGLGSGVIALASAYGHNCVLMSDRAMKCWGTNYSGELGIGNPVDTQPIATSVVGIDAPVLEMALGGGHTCALTVSGGVKCWGVNSSHQLGRTTPSITYTALDVIGLPPNVSAIAAGTAHTCALVSGGVKCWGGNFNGQLGTGLLGGTTPNPSDVIGATSGIVAIDASGETTCALTAGGQVKCWGYNLDGQLGNGTGKNSLVPVDVAVGTAVAIVVGGSHACAIRADGSTICWGSNRSGVFANGKAAYYAYPVAVVHAGCGGFEDIEVSNAFCANVEWARNRGITQGCTASSYCPDQAVTRVAMGAFMTRSAVPYTSAPVLAEQVSGPLDPDLSPVVCVIDVPVAGYPRSAQFDAVLTARSLTAVSADLAAVASRDGGITWTELAGRPFSLQNNRWVNVRALAATEVAAGASLRLGLRLARMGPPGTGRVEDSSCMLRIRAWSRGVTAPPYDSGQPGIR